MTSTTIAPTTVSVPATHSDLLSAIGWNHIHTIEFPAREGRRLSPASLGLSRPAEAVASVPARGLYEHQMHAIKSLISGEDTATATGTGSGKSLVFHTAAIEQMAKDPAARILVLYPLRALAEEQHERWNAALRVAGIEQEALLLIGDSISVAQRAKALSKARVVVATPDIIHAWLMLKREKETAIRNFLRHLRLVAIDEAHAYTAVFGSQSAFLFRRLDHAVRKLGGRFQVAAASATMAEAEAHLHALTGRRFTIIGAEHDSSPVQPKRLHYVDPAGGLDLISGLGRWFRTCADSGDSRFLAFVESRVQAEHFALVAARQSADEDTEEAIVAQSGNAVRAYRSGYDSFYRRELVSDLRERKIAGLVSTSALELGMDLPDLGLGFIIGVPHSATSLWQRLGRFGRHGPADIFIVSDGTQAATDLFADPESILRFPLQRSTLYLDNPRVQYIHALCQAHEEHWGELETPPTTFESEVDFPKGFLDLCGKELRGESVGELRSMRPAGDEPPHYAFPLRDCDLQFVVKCGRGHSIMQLGTLTFAQVLREAYRCAEPCVSSVKTRSPTHLGKAFIVL